MCKNLSTVAGRMKVKSLLFIINIGSTALGGHRPPQANVASNLYPLHLPAIFYNPVSLHLPPPRAPLLLHVVPDISVQLHP
jgi:hypothetical protein